MARKKSGFKKPNLVGLNPGFKKKFHLGGFCVISWVLSY